ncbi:restriction endonuclease subunit S [Vibrio crassostreae]|uniref:restriction endonuclease subunit S n=1 Tax=Vibrio crassostreae TaxID=246167 RepID=UPI001B30CB59|nr:restriction endonuclease subunit S [Vibrio crassostreae]
MSCNQTLTIGDIAQVFDGPHATPKKIEAGPYFLSISSLENGKLDLSKSAHVSDEDFKKWTRRVTPEEGDILFSYETRLGEVAMMPAGITACLGRRMGLLRPDRSKILPEYLLYAYQSPPFQETIRSKTIHGATVDRIALKELPSFQIQVPPLSVQEKIVNVLKGYDRKLMLNSETNQTLEEMAQAIFKSWFVDFDPVKAKMNGERPEGMDAATASLFPEKLVESELGLIPEGWEVTKLSKVIDLLNGFAFKSPDYVKEGTFVLRTKNFDSSNSVERLGDDVYLPDEFLESHKKYLCEAYDYHVVMVAASIGKTGMIYPHQLPALRNQNMWCFRPKNESLRFYTKYMVDGLVKLNMGLASGSARAFFKKGDFNSYEFALPSSELLTKFNDVVGNLVKQKGSLLNQNVQLAAMRDTLLPKLLSGEIDLEMPTEN